MVRWLALLLLVCDALQAAAGEEALAWRPRALRAPSPSGYLAVALLKGTGNGPAHAVLVCEREGVELRAQGNQWAVSAGGTPAKSGVADGDSPRTLCVKRTPARLLLGLNGRWVYDQGVAAPDDAPAVRVGVAAGLAVESLQLVPREPVRFADDFPDPEPKPGRWAPVRGRWALSSLTSPEHSANPAELAALFDSLEDEASRGRTRHSQVGVGLFLAGGRYPFIAGVATDSPAERAGLRYGERIQAVNGAEARGTDEAMELLAGNEGTTVRVTVEEKAGKTRTVELRRELITWGKSRRQVLIEPYRPGDDALMTAGEDYWTDYAFTTAVRTQHVGAFGLVFAYQGPDDYHVFRWLGADKVEEGTGRWQLERVRGGQRAVLASREGGFAPRDFYAMSLTLSGDQLGQIKAVGAVDGTPVVEASDDAIVPGRIGFWAEAPGVVCFDDVFVSGDGADAHRATAGTLNEVQRFDQHMKAWGNPVYAWQYDSMGSLWWHKDDFPGDVTVSSPLGASNPFRLVVSAMRGTATSGYAFEIEVNTQKTALKRADKVVAEKPLGDRKPTKAVLARKGGRIGVELDGKPWLSYDDPEPLRGSAVLAAGIPLSGFRPSADVAVESPNVVEYYFNGAPMDWHVMHGTWEVMNRWICDPRWSFFGGRGDGALAIWNKRRLEGDCFAEVFAGPMMLDRSGSYENMRDLGLTLCGDGKNLASGYTLLVGANGNEMTALFRNGRMVASRRDSESLLPHQALSENATLFPSRHRGWVPIALAKQGNSIQAYLLDRLILTYVDPEPLPGGYTAFWSVDNGVLVAKVRLAATRVSPPQVEPFLRSHRRFSDAVLTNDCAEGEARIEDRGSEYEVTNAVGGGPFAVAFRPRVYSAFERPTISFDLKLAPDVKVDLYVTCRGHLYRIIVAGPTSEDGGATTLGRVEGVKADGEWHHVQFDLLAALKKEHADDPLLLVWQPMLANFATHDYLIAGFHGNPAGARYWLRNISLPLTEDRPRVSQKPTDM